MYNVRVFDVTNFDVTIGQTFSLHTSFSNDIRWFSDNDQILDIKAEKNNVEVTVGSTEGVSTILIMDKQKTILKELTIRVYNVIPLPADTLDAIANPPQPK
jgi:hypothetical protein